MGIVARVAGIRASLGGLLGAWLGGLLGAIAPIVPAQALCPANLPGAVAAVTAQAPLARARLGVQVETLDGRVVYSREGDRFFVPASTLKVLTTAAVLTRMGPGMTLRTSVYGDTNPGGLTTLRVVGRGDPSFDTADLTALATQLRQRGTGPVSHLIGDESTLPGNAVNPNWEWEDVQAGYGAPVNALILNGNAFGLRLIPQGIGQPLQVVWDNPALGAIWQIDNRSRTVAEGAEFISVGRDLGGTVLRVQGQLLAGSAPEPVAIAVPNPGEAFLIQFRQVLNAEGISVGQTSLTYTATQAEWPELAAVQSPTLGELLIPTNQASNNLYAEALLKLLGQGSETGQDATVAGAAIALRLLGDMGLEPGTVVMVDGSGLSRHNLVTPEAMVTVLQGMARSPFAAVYRRSLAVAGVSGTLRNRLKGTAAEGRLFGKSGAVSRNFSLAGYLEPPDYEPLVFNIVINNIDAQGAVARGLIDDIVVHLAQLRPCP